MDAWLGWLTQARGTFVIELDPTGRSSGGAAARFAFTKTFAGRPRADEHRLDALRGRPAAGRGRVRRARGGAPGRSTGGRAASSSARPGGWRTAWPSSECRVVAGTGTGDLAGISGSVAITVVEASTTDVVEYALPQRPAEAATVRAVLPLPH